MKRCKVLKIPLIQTDLGTQVGYDYARHHIKVLIFNNAKDLTAYYYSHFKGSGADEIGGFYHKNVYAVRFFSDGHTKIRMKREWGVIGFHRENLRSEVIAHECCHFAMQFIQPLKDIAPNADPDNIEFEEEICYQTGHLHREIVNLLYEKGYWK